MPNYQAPRGMNDTLPDDAALWRHIRDTAERVARLFDYRAITTPIVEDAGVFLRTVGDESDIVQKEMYVFDDRGGDRLALRPEGTAAICRAYIEHGMGSWPQPVRLFYLGPFFRYDRPQAGRYRQLWQFGAEAIGSDSPALDAELIELQHTLYEALGLTDLVLRINSIGNAESRARYIDALRDYFRPLLPGLSKDSQRRFETNVLRILDSKEAQDRDAVGSAPSILAFLSDDDAAHFEAVKSALEAVGIAYEVDPYIVRGLDYYSRTVWEFEPQSTGGQSTVGAGGRYDGLMELLGGQPTPGVGFATGIERIAMNLKERGPASVPKSIVGPDVYIVVGGERHVATALSLARAQRRQGRSVVVGDSRRSFKAQVRHGDQIGAKDQIPIGDREFTEKFVTLRDLVRSENYAEAVPLDPDVLAFVTTFSQVERLAVELIAKRHGNLTPDQARDIWREFPNHDFVTMALEPYGLLDAYHDSHAVRNRIVHGADVPTGDDWTALLILESLLDLRLRSL